jgi:hypothetical protein
MAGTPYPEDESGGGEHVIVTGLRSRGEKPGRSAAREKRKARSLRLDGEHH